MSHRLSRHEQKVLLLGPDTPHQPVRQALSECKHVNKLSIDKHIHSCCLRCRRDAWGDDDLCSFDLPCSECFGQPELYYELIDKNVERNKSKQSRRKLAKAIKNAAPTPNQDGQNKSPDLPELGADTSVGGDTGELLHEVEDINESHSYGIANI